MLPFHKGERITTTAGGATLTGFSATVKGASADEAKQKENQK